MDVTVVVTDAAATDSSGGLPVQVFYMGFHHAHLGYILAILYDCRTRPVPQTLPEMSHDVPLLTAGAPSKVFLRAHAGNNPSYA